MFYSGTGLWQNARLWRRKVEQVTLWRGQDTAARGAVAWPKNGQRQGLPLPERVRAAYGE